MPSPTAAREPAAVRVLLVDDNPAFLRTTKRLLQECSTVAVVDAIGIGESALVRAEELHPDIVLIDLTMPDLPVLKAIARLRALLPQTGIIALTSLGTDGPGQAVLATGADDLVSKATISTELLPAIQRIVRDRLGNAEGLPPEYRRTDGCPTAMDH